MTIPSLTAINPAPLAATKSGAPAIQTTASATDTQVQLPQQQPLVNALDAVLAAARQSAAASQDGLAVLMANALRAVTAKALPDAVQKAVDQLLALHMPTDTPPDAQSVKTALQTSGLFTEANLASGALRIPVDVKTALLQLNQTAQAWLARAALAADPKLEAAATQVPVAVPPAPRQTQKSAKSGAAPKGPDTPSAAARTGPSSPQAPTPSAARPMAEAAAKSLAPVTARPVAPAPAQAVMARPVAPAQTSSTPESTATAQPEAFKPVMQLLTQAAEALQPEVPTPQMGQTNPSQPVAQGKASPAPQPCTPDSIKTASPPALQPAQVKIAVALLDRAAKAWPAPQAGAMPLAMAGSKIATQAFATAPEEPASMPPAIKAVLAQIEKAVAPFAAGEPRPSPPAESASKPPSNVMGRTDSNTATGKPAAPDATGRAPVAAPPSRPSATATSPVPLDGETNVPTQDTPPVALPASAPAPSATGPAAKPSVPNELRNLLGMLNKIFESAPEPVPANAPEARPGTPNVPPPAAGSPSKAQGTAAPTLPEHADAALIAKSLVTGSDAALARQTLLQIASLPDPAVQNRTNEARWIFDLPVMTGQGAAVAQVIIERDGRNTSGDAPRPVWRVQFALDIEPLGPVRANLAISGEHAWVTIGAERPESLAKLQSHAASLSDALQSQSLEADIAFQSGAVPQAVRRGKPLVDSAS